MISSHIAPTLYSRLACACNCAYGISPETGTYSPPAIYDSAVHWSNEPKAVAARSDLDTSNEEKLINACLLGINQDGIIVAFRGTLPLDWTIASVEDWWQDIVESEPESAPPLPGKVHKGFWDALCSLWESVLQEVKSLKATRPDTPIYITGHSKGGPLASMCAARLLLEEEIKAEQVVTFASPHPGNQGFVSQYPAQLPITRFENYLDIVPFVPPTKTFFEDLDHIDMDKVLKHLFPNLYDAWKKASAFDYEALGSLSYITREGKVVDAQNPSAAYDWRLLEIFWTVLGLPSESADPAVLKKRLAEFVLSKNEISHSGFSEIGAAHCISCKANTSTDLCAGGYMTGAGGDPICPPCTTN